jgi:pyruvate/2-oxoglutarate dehydrogenase complex dihydrolipoamide acyltransferase (E2) component
MDLIGKYRAQRIPIIRRSTIDVSERGRRRHHAAGLLQLDVTDARRCIHDIRVNGGDGFSFTAWVIKCISRAVSEYPQVHAIRRRGRLFIFDDIDVALPVEREVAGEKLPLTYIIRKCNEKSAAAISREIRSAREEAVGEGETMLGEKKSRRLESLFLSSPYLLRRLVWRRLERDPFFAKKQMGTVLVTTVGMYGKIDGWPVPVSIHPLCFALGPVVTKPGIVGGVVAPREFLKLTVLVDHDVIDGAPAARFAAHLGELMESAACLDEEPPAGG